MNILAYVHLRNIYGSTGHGRVARQMTEHLALEANSTLHILAAAEDHRRVIHKVGAPWDGFTYHFFDKKPAHQQAQWMLTGRPTAEHFWRETELVYCTYESYVPTRRARLVVTLHDAAIFENDVLPRHLLVYRERLKSAFMHARLAKKTDLIHTVSEFSAERLAHFFPALGSRLCVVYNGVSPVFFSPVTDAGKQFLQRHGLTDRPFVLLPGGLHYRKNAELILQAWKPIHQHNPDVQLVIAGHNHPTYLEHAKALGDGVHITGFVDDDALCALYDAAQVVWFPSRYEGFGMPVIEAMARGTAVVTSNTTALPEVAGDAALLVPPASVSENVEAITALLEDSGWQQELGKRGKLRAQHFTWPRAAARLRQSFSDLI